MLMTPEQIDALNMALPDDYSRTLLKGGLRVLNDIENPIRMNLFAAAGRELFTHVLKYYAPDAEVRGCDWFKQDPSTPNKVSRRQRATYATQGGLSDAFVQNEVGLDVKPLHHEMVLRIEALNKATHVQEDRIESDPAKIQAFADEALTTLIALLDSFSECRDAVQEALRDALYLALMDAFVQHTFGDLDLLSSHGYEVSSITTDKVTVTAIRSSDVEVVLDGVAHVTLHYGSGDDAAEINHDFPISMTCSAPTNDPFDLTLVNHSIDDSSWFDNGDDL
jgi:hypothetical protein